MVYSTHEIRPPEFIDELILFRHVVEHFPAAVLITNTEGKIIYVNSVWEVLTGYEEKEVLGKNPNLLNSGKTPVYTYQNLWHALLHNRSYFTEDVINRRKDGTEYQIHSMFFPVVHNGVTKFYVQIEEDITYRKKLDSLKKEFLSAAAHELKTPITTLKLMIESGLRKSKNTKDVTVPVAAFRLVDRELNRLTRLINDLSDVSRLETGKFNLNIDVADITELIRESIEQMKTISSGHIFIFHSRKHIPVIADGGRVKQVLINIINNAIKYSAPQTPIEIAIEEAKQEVIISIKDHGAGIPADYLSHIFDRFYQIEENMKSGMGLGLYIAKQIIEQHKGKIWVESKVGKGSTFYFTLKKAK